MATRKKKAKAKLTSINMGAEFEVEVNGKTYRFSCSGESKYSNRDPNEVIQSIQKCIEDFVAETSSKHG